MYALKIYFENGSTKYFFLGEAFSFVEVSAANVLKKYEAYDVLKWVRKNSIKVSSKYFILTDFIFPLDKEGKLYGNVDVTKYEIYLDNKLFKEIIPSIDIENVNEFWDELLKIPV